MSNEVNSYVDRLNSNYSSMFGDSSYGNAAQVGNGISGLGWNMPSYQLGIQGVMGLGNLWAAFKGLSQAKKEYEFNKRITEKNLENSTKSYNTALTDKAYARQSAMGNMSDDDVKKYIALNQLSK